MRRSIAALVLLAVTLGIAATDVAAQERDFTACCVPAVGAMYLINLPGLPDACLSPGHEEVSWAEGGDGRVLDGSIGTSALADGSVTASKLAEGQVLSRHIRDRQVTREKIGLGSIDGAALDIRYQKVWEKVAIPPGETGSAFVGCPEGTFVLGGGAWDSTGPPGYFLKSELLFSSPNGGVLGGSEGWSAGARNPNDFVVEISAIAICADIR